MASSFGLCGREREIEIDRILDYGLPTPAIAGRGLHRTAPASIPPWNSFRRPLCGVQPRLRMDHARTLLVSKSAAGARPKATSISDLEARVHAGSIPYQKSAPSSRVIPQNSQSFGAGAQPISLGQGAFTPLYAQLVNRRQRDDRSIPKCIAVLIYNVGNGTNTSFPSPKIADTPVPLSATASTDGSQVFVQSRIKVRAESAPRSVHIVSTTKSIQLAVWRHSGRCPSLNINARTTTHVQWTGHEVPLCLRTWWPSAQ